MGTNDGVDGIRLMTVEDFRTPATDGYLLSTSVFKPSGEVHVPLVIAGAIGVRRRLYNRYARFLCRQGFQVTTFDYRSMGDSRLGKLRRSNAVLRDWGEKDLTGVIEHARQGGEVLIVAHSLGGQMVGIAPNNGKISAMLTVAAQSGHWGFWPFPQKLALAALWHAVVPGLTAAFGYFPGSKLGLSEDLAPGVAKQWAQWCRNPAYVVDAGGAPDRKLFQAFEAPMRCYSFEGDHYAPLPAVEELMSWYSNAPKQHRHLKRGEFGVRSLGHFGFFREKTIQPLWRETADWLKTASKSKVDPPGNREVS